MADKAYTGASLVLPTRATRAHPLTAEQKAANRMISGYLVIIEHMIA